MSDHWPRTITVYLFEEDKEILDRLCDESGLNRSAQMRELLRKVAYGEEGSSTAEIRKHVAALAKLIL